MRRARDMQDSGFWIYLWTFRIQDSGVRIHPNRIRESGFRIHGPSGFRIQDSGYRMKDTGFRIHRQRFRIQESGFRIHNKSSKDAEVRIKDA